MKQSGLLFIFAVSFLVSYFADAAPVCTGVHLSTRETVSNDFIESRTEEFIEKRRCTCCHTTLTFAMAVKNPQNSFAATTLRNYISDRMSTWNQYKPWPGPYPAQKVRPTEAILNAVSLVSMDVNSGSTQLTPLTYQALDLMLQEVGVRKWPDGRTEPIEKSFEWIDHLSLAPFEGTNADYWGAAVAAEALSKTPKSYQNRADVKEKLEFIKHDLKNRFESQDLHNRLVAIMASKKLGNFLNEAQVQSTLENVKDLQRTDTESGAVARNSVLRGSGRIENRLSGWALPEIAYTSRQLPVAAKEKIDAYATSLVVITLISQGDRSSRVKEGLAWLLKAQKSDGSWVGQSLQRGTATQFMTDTASAYARMALDLGARYNLLP